MLAIEPGTQLDRYDCLHQVGKGGMASVWVARQVGKHGFEKLVAVKTVLPELAEDVDILKMLLDEAHILAGIRHPNVAAVLDLGEQEDLFYLVFEWVDGEQLSKLRRALNKRKTRMPLGIALRIVADTCAGLHAAHELCDVQGWPLYIVHRDVSPQNIMIGTLGDVKVIDFGVAKAMDRVAGDTQSGKLKGKTLYMAPEQIRGDAVDRRIDIWAAGVVLYQLVANRLPYRTDKTIDLLKKLANLEEPMPLPSVVPEAVAAVIMRALRPVREERYQTAAEMQRDIEDVIVRVQGSVTAADVAALANEYMGDVLEAKRVAIAEALDDANKRPHRGKHKAAQEAIATRASPSSDNGELRSQPSASAVSVSSPDAAQSSLVSLRPSTSACDLIPDDVAEEGLGEPAIEGGRGKLVTRLRSPSGIAVLLIASALLLFLLVVVAHGGRDNAIAARPAGVSPPVSLMGMVAQRIAESAVSAHAPPPTPVPSATPVQSASAAPARSPKAPAYRPAKTPKKDPLDVFGTR